MKKFENKNITLILALSLVVIAVIMSVGSTSAANIGVNQTAAAPGETIYYNNIGSAIENASNNDLITIYNGTYQGPNNRNITINKNLTIQGAAYAGKGTGQTIIDAQQLSRIFTIVTNCNITFSGITFINGTNTIGGAIYQGENGSITLNNNTLNNNNATDGGAIYQNYNGSITLNNNTLNNNNAVSNGGAIFQNFNGTLSINLSTLNNNIAAYGAAIYKGANGSLTINNSNFTNNSDTIATQTDNVSFNNNNILNNGKAFVIICSDTNVNLAKYLSNNNIKNNDYYFSLRGSRNTIKNFNLSPGSSGNQNGIIVSSANNTLNNVNIGNFTNGTGLFLNTTANGNYITNSTIARNKIGLSVEGYNNTINYNRILKNNIDVIAVTGVTNDGTRNHWGTNNPGLAITGWGSNFNVSNWFIGKISTDKNVYLTG